MYSALLIAKYIIRHCAEHGWSISNLKLQKILYFVQAEFLVDIGSCCFNDTIEAWDFGPVVPTVYHAYKNYGSASIPAETTDGYHDITDEDKNRIDMIVDACSKYSAARLVDITHKQSPWMDAYEYGANNEITSESIKTFFE